MAGDLIRIRDLAKPEPALKSAKTGRMPSVTQGCTLRSKLLGRP